MAIRFPKLHIAESVVNRILNVADGIDTGPSDTPAAPAAPNPAALEVKGAALDFQLFQPPTGPLPGIENAPEVALGKPVLPTLIER